MKATIYQSRSGFQATLQNGAVYLGEKGAILKNFKAWVSDAAFEDHGIAKVSFNLANFGNVPTPELVKALQTAEHNHKEQIEEELATRDDYKPSTHFADDLGDCEGSPEDTKFVGNVVLGLVSEEFSEEKTDLKIINTDANLTLDNPKGNRRFTSFNVGHPESMEAHPEKEEEPTTIKVAHIELEKGEIEEVEHVFLNMRIKEIEANNLQSAKERLNKAVEKFEALKASLQQDLEAIEVNTLASLNATKLAYENGRIEASDVCEMAENAYREARKTVAFNNQGTTKTEEEKQADIDRIAEAKAALDKVREDIKKPLADNEAAYKAAKASYKSQIKTAKMALRKQIVEAKLEADNARIAYGEVLKNTKANVQTDVINYEQLVQVAKTKLDTARKNYGEAKALLNESRKIINEKPLLRLGKSKATLEKALADRQHGEQFVDSIVWFCPARTTEPIKGQIIATTLDKRTNIAYYRLIGDADGKMYHVKIDRLDVEKCKVN